MSDATEFPTADRLHELREKGSVSYSSRSGSCLIVAALSLAALGAPSALAQFAALLSLDRSQVTWQGIGDALSGIMITWLLVPGVTAAALLVFWGFLQTRFLFNLGLISLDLARLLPKTSFSAGLVARRLGRALLTFLAAAFGALFLLKMVGHQIFRSMHQPTTTGVAVALGELMEILPIVILVSSLAALVLLMFEKLRFALSHRMSRKDVLAEQQG